MKICIITLGCKVNQYESQSLGEILRTQGNEIVYKLETADIYFLNSCAVTNEAERKSRQTIAKFNKLNPNCKIYVFGCASQNNPDQFTKLKNVQYVMGNATPLALLDNLDKKGKKILKHPDHFEEISVSTITNARVYVKIQDGCNRFCSYCLIPYLRGRSRSRDIISILTEIDSLTKNGAKEIVLTGVDISDFKIDEKHSLLELLQKINDFNVRFRIGSLEPNLITTEFLKELKKLKHFCPHFHLSMQSGSSSVLNRMNRKYSKEFFIQRTKLIYKYFGKNCAITTDIIVGFPGETDLEFAETLKTVKKCKFSQIHCFPYSRRTGTTADRLLNNKSNKNFYIINPAIIKSRMKQLTTLSHKLSLKFLRKQKNHILEVVVEEKKDNYYVGTSQNYINTYFESPKNYVNQIINIRIKKIFLDGVLGKIIYNK